MSFASALTSLLILAAPPPPPATHITVVTATRLARPLRDLPQTVVVLPRAELDRSPSVTLEAKLRNVPSFATFRRNTSLTSDPSALGLNLRGLGPSGVSRALVLLDGIPMNDPFGGWIDWRGLPRLGLDRAELLLGGGSALYGSAALGGVLELFTRAPVGGSVDADAHLANLRTGGAGLRLAQRWESVGAALEVDALGTGGYVPVAPLQRGPIDGPASADHQMAHGRVTWNPASTVTLSLQGGAFRHAQNGGTSFTTADSRAAYGGFTARIETTAGALDARLYARVHQFDQVRARIALDRSVESIAGTQHVPSNETGAALVFAARPLRGAGTHQLSAGLELRQVNGVAEEQLFSAAPSAPVRTRRSGGRQQFAGVFFQELYQPVADVELSAAVRLDGWRNLPRLTSTPLELSPRAGVRWRALPSLTVRGSAYRAFRAPTLNELYRPFQVGTVLTAANDRLAAEGLIGGELGLEGVWGAWIARATGFYNALDRPVVNVTLPVPDTDGAQRQRQNLGRADVRGVELSLEGRIAPSWSLALAYTFVDARVVRSPPEQGLLGKQLAQDPAHRAALTLTYDDPRVLTAVLQLRALGFQWEDDLNTLGMPGVALVDFSIARRLVKPLEVFVAVENLFNQSYLVGRAGVDTLGPPLLARVGLRVRAGP